MQTVLVFPEIENNMAEEIRTGLKAKLKITTRSIKSLKNSCSTHKSVVTRLHRVVNNQLLQLAECMSAAESSALAEDVMVSRLTFTINSA